MKLNSILSIVLIVILSVSVSAQETSSENKYIPIKDNIWVFLMAGQSNMAGRGIVEPMDTIINPRILCINGNGELILAKEPLNIYEPNLKGLDCGLSFSNELLQHIPDSVSILLIPTAIGGSSIDQWIGDSVHRNINLLSNFREKVKIAKNYGTIKGLLWHQGESDAKPLLVTNYSEKLSILFQKFRTIIENKKLPILTGEIGTFTADSTFQNFINSCIVNNVKKDKYAFLIQTDDLTDKGDQLHFDSKSQRKMGKRFAQKYLDIK